MVRNEPHCNTEHNAILGRVKNSALCAKHCDREHKFQWEPVIWRRFSRGITWNEPD